MKKIELVPGIVSSVLGFGCAPILGSIDSKKARSAIACAIDHEINHFDLARSYGYGEAEHFVGKMIKGKRNKLVLASKFGIKANWKALLLRPAKPFIRLMLARKQAYHSNAKPIHNSRSNMADNFHNRIMLDGKEMQKNLERSLRELRTDYLDYFFIHEPPEKLFCIEELALTADLLKKQGKIRALGLAYTRDNDSLHHSYINCFDILQFDLSPGAPGYEDVLKNRSHHPNIIFSPFRGGTNELNPPEKLQKLLHDFKNTVILCSMFNENHIKANAILASV